MIDFFRAHIIVGTLCSFKRRTVGMLLPIAIVFCLISSAPTLAQGARVEPNNEFGEEAAYQKRENPSTRWEGYVLKDQSAEANFPTVPPQLIGVYSNIACIQRLFATPKSALASFSFQASPNTDEAKKFFISTLTKKEGSYYGMSGEGQSDKPFYWPLGRFRNENMSMAKTKLFAWFPEMTRDGSVVGSPNPGVDAIRDGLLLVPLQVSFTLDPYAEEPKLAEWEWQRLSVPMEPSSTVGLGNPTIDGSFVLLFSTQGANGNIAQVKAYVQKSNLGSSGSKQSELACAIWTAKKPSEHLLALAIQPTDFVWDRGGKVEVKITIKYPQGFRGGETVLYSVAGPALPAATKPENAKPAQEK